MEIPVRGNVIKPGRKSRSTRQINDILTIVLFLTPAFILFLVFLVFPIIRSVYYSLFDWNGLGPAVDFVGLDNFKQILSDQVFIKAAMNAVLIVALSLAVQLPLALALAIMVGRDLPGRAFFRMIFFMPYVLSEVIAAIIWLSMFSPDPERGLINAILTLIPGVQAQNFLGDTNAVMVCVFVVLTWKYFGLHMLLDMAGLQNIPKEVEEAAMIDGAGRWQAFRYVTLPLLGPTIRVSVFLSIIGALQLFDLVFVITGGGPITMGASGATVDASGTMALDMFKTGFTNQSMGAGSAVAVLLFVFCFVVALGYQRLVLRRDVEGALTTNG